MTNGRSDDERDETAPILSRRAALRAGTALTGAAAIGGAGLWVVSQPSVAVSVTDTGADNVVFGTDENVVSVTEVTIRPEIDVGYGNFSSGIDTAEIEIRVRVDAEKGGNNYEGEADTDWGAPKDRSEWITLSDTITADGSTETYSTAIGNFDIETPDLTGQTDSGIGDDGTFEFTDAIPIHDVIEGDGGITEGEGIDMFPQDIDPGMFGRSDATVDYAVTLTGAKGDSDTDDSTDHDFHVVVENEEGSVDGSEVDSNTGGKGDDGTD